jgi:hypothetical protein
VRAAGGTHAAAGEGQAELAWSGWSGSLPLSLGRWLTPHICLMSYEPSAASSIMNGMRLERLTLEAQKLSN